jgi:protein phosphatase 2C family protein 2/3
MEMPFLAFFDGHGGEETALFVEKHFCKTLKELKSYKSKDYKTALEECFMKMDKLMLSEEHASEFKNEDGPKGQGCTATTILITDTEVFCANAGDSRTVASIKGKA